MSSLASHVSIDKSRLLPQQKRVIRSRADYILFDGGRGFGKTRAGLWSVFLRCRAQSGQKILIGAQTYRQTRDVIIDPWVEEFHPDYYQHLISKDEIIVYSIDGGESKILVRSLENQKKVDKIKGMTLTGYYLAQAEQIPVSAFTMLEACLRDTSNSHLWFRLFDANAGSKSHWLYRHFIDTKGAEYLGNDHIKVERIHARSEDNPFAFSKNQLEVAKKTLGDKLFKLEYEGEWGAAVGKIYSLQDGVQIRDDKPSGDMRYYLALDHGYNFAALLIGATGPHNHVLGESIVIDGDHEDHLAGCMQLLKEHKVTELDGLIGDISGRYPMDGGRIVDSNRWLATTIRDRLGIENISVIPTSKSRSIGWKRLKKLFNDDRHGKRARLTVSSKCPILIRSLDEAEWDPEMLDTLPFYDHPPDALRYYSMSKAVSRMDEDGNYDL